MSLSHSKKHRLRTSVYVGGFFLNTAIAVAAYTNSSFVTQFVSEKSLGLIYAAIAILCILVSFNTDSLIKRFGNRTILTILILADILAIGGLVYYRNSAPALIFFIVYAALNFLISINLDLYLEEISDDRITGKIRGIFLMLANCAWLCSPLLAAFLLDQVGFGAVYILSGLALLPLAFISLTKLINIPRERYEHVGIWGTLWRILKAKGGTDKDLRCNLTLDFLLNFFYVIMVVYGPIYLHAHVGLGWDRIGIIFTIALIPFVVLDFVLGWIADTFLGEKELMIVGILIMSFSTLLIPLLKDDNLFWWALILFLTRVGAATLEMMKESYLFKKIDGRDIDVVFISRNTLPVADLAGPIVATLWLTFFPFQYMFALLGFIMLLGLPAALALTDTR